MKKMGKDGNWNPDVHAEWTSIDICGHGMDEYFSKKIRWIEVPMMSKSDKNGIKAKRWAGGILTLGFSELVGAALVGGFYDHTTHECIEVHFGCKQCPKEKVYLRTYELVNPEIGTTKRWGFYAKEYQEENQCSTRHSFDEVESKFDDMWSNYSVAVGRHCKKWSKEFFSKLL